MSRFAVLALAAVSTLSAGCASSSAWPRMLSAGDVRVAPTLHGEWIATYEEAIASVGSVMSRQLGLPPVQAGIYFHRDREAFRSALEAQGYDPALASDTAATLSAVSGFRRVHVNDATMSELGWPIKVALLSHELTHTLQYEWSGGTRGTSDQWLREGFAEWVEMEVLVALGFTTRPQAQRVLLNRLRDMRVSRLPALREMVTFPQWVALAQRFGQEAVYGHAGLAARYLIERHGLEAAIDYFSRFAESPDREENFRAVYGQTLAEFEAAFGAHLAALMR